MVKVAGYITIVQREIVASGVWEGGIYDGVLKLVLL